MLLSEVLSPFEAPANEGAHRFAIAVTPTGWRFGFDDGEQAETDDPWYLLFRTRVLLAERALSGAELATLHGGIVTRGPHALVLAGRSGAGKSTLVTELADRGWDFGGDEFAPIDEGGCAYPLTFPAVIEGTSGWDRWRARWEVPAWMPEPKLGYAIAPSAFDILARPALVSRVLFIRFETGHPGQSDALSAARALSLAGENAFLMNPVRFASLARLFRAVPASQITYGSTEQAILLVEAQLGETSPLAHDGR